MLTPTRKDRIDDKLLAIEGLAKVARERLYANSERYIKCVSEIGTAYRELELYIKTPEKRGRGFGWWK